LRRKEKGGWKRASGFEGKKKKIAPKTWKKGEGSVRETKAKTDHKKKNHLLCSGKGGGVLEKRKKGEKGNPELWR